MHHKVGIWGATGRMGQELTALLRDGFSVENDTLLFSNDVSLAQVWVDFSQPEGTVSLLEKIQAPVVIGTTGFTGAQLERIHHYAKTQPVLLSSNMSPGMNLVLKILKDIPPLSSGFDAVVSEIHHKKKKDAPSGTALSILSVLKEMGYDSVQVESVRAGNVKGVHRVSFIGEDEEFSIEHRVFNRTVFARGALLAAHFILRQKPALFTMEDLWTKNEVMR